MPSNNVGTEGAESHRSRVWVITGTSSGLGRSLVNAALARGDCVVATARNIDSIRGFADDPETASRMHIMNLDVTAPFAELRALAGQAVTKWGRVDVLVNNAGEALLGITEEIGVEGYQKQFNTNFFGPLNVTNAFLPYMRERREGMIVFIGSRSSWRSNLPMIGAYASSKAAITAAAEALAVEVAPLNIKVLNVLPGGLQTRSWNEFTIHPTVPEALLPPITKQIGAEQFGSDAAPSASSQTSANLEDSKEQRITDYAELVKRQVEWARTASVHINGDTDKCARAIVDVATGSNTSLKGVAAEANFKETGRWPELNMLILGADAEADIRDKCHAILRNLDEWKDLVRGIALDA